MDLELGNDIQLFKYVLSRQVKITKKEFRVIGAAAGVMGVHTC